MNTLRRFSRRAWLLHAYLVLSIFWLAMHWARDMGKGGVGSSPCGNSSDIGDAICVGVV